MNKREELQSKLQVLDKEISNSVNLKTYSEDKSQRKSSK